MVFPTLGLGREEREGLTLELARWRPAGAEAVEGGERPHPGFIVCLYAEVVQSGFGQPLHLERVAGAAVDAHEPRKQRI